MPSLENRIFPEIYVLGENPPKCMTVEKDKYYSMPTPAYGYGWAISRTELFEAFYNQPCPDLRRFELSRMHKAADCRIYSAWTKNGYDYNNYSPKIPHSGRIGKDYVLIYIACNDSHEIMDDIMANKKYHDLCRESLGNPETMKLEPAWFRVGLADMPKRVKELGAREN